MKQRLKYTSRYVALGRECTLPEPLTSDADVRAAIDKLRSYGLHATDGR